MTRPTPEQMREAAKALRRLAVKNATGADPGPPLFALLVSAAYLERQAQRKTKRDAR